MWRWVLEKTGIFDALREEMRQVVDTRLDEISDNIGKSPTGLEVMQMMRDKENQLNSE